MAALSPLIRGTLYYGLAGDGMRWHFRRLDGLGIIFSSEWFEIKLCPRYDIEAGVVALKTNPFSISPSSRHLCEIPGQKIQDKIPWTGFNEF